ICAGLSIGWGIDGMHSNDASGLWLAIGLGGLMIVNCFLVHGQHSTSQETLRPQPAYFAGLALVAWLVTTWNNTSHDNFPLILGIEALLLTFSFYLLRIPEITLLSQ